MGKKHSKNCLSCIDISVQQNPVTSTDAERRPDENLKDAVSLTNYPWLTVILDSHNGLLDELWNCGLLNQLSQVERIKSKDSRRFRGSQLLCEVGMLAPDKLELFLSALDKTQQSHVTNYIRNNGQQTVTQDDNWPAIDEYIRMRNNWSKLLELIDTRNGLCNELISAQCITFNDRECIKQHKVTSDQNEELLNIMSHVSRKDFKKFLDCFIKTKQLHVAALLDPNIAQNVQTQPVDEKLVASLIKNYSALVQLIDLKQSGLMCELCSANVITWYQKEFIKSAATDSESNERLLDCMKRGSQLDYDNFIECLHRTRQQHVADLLRNDGVVAEMVAQTSLPSAGEDAVVEEFFKYYRKTSTQIRQQLCDRLLIDALQDNRLIALQTEHSIKLFFFCRSVSGILHLNDLYSTKKLEIIVEQLLTVLLDNEQPVKLHGLIWNVSNYNNCVQNLSSSSDLQVYSQIHQLAQLQLPDVTIEPSVFSLDENDELPHELIELLIIRAAGTMFANFTKMTTSRADVLTLTTLNSVCRYWWQTLTYRRNNRKLLRQFFELHCAPYRFNPKLVTQLNFQDCHITGVAELDHKLYIVAETSNTVRVMSRVHFNFRDVGEDIKVPELIHPADIVACRIARCLYISDTMTRCIWRVNLSPSLNTPSVEKFITLDYEPFQLSLQSNRLSVTEALVTEVGGRALYIYSCVDGELLRKIERNGDDVIGDDEAQPEIGRLLRYANIMHAAETAEGRLIVCHRPRYSIETEHKSGVSEVSGDGQVLHTYECATKSILSRALTVDSRNHILVCDYNNRQILRLNSELTLQQVLLTELAGFPLRLCYSEQTGLLYICYYASPNIDVYKVTSG